jgi:type 1 glutamine amidotransferase
MLLAPLTLGCTSAEAPPPGAASSSVATSGSGGAAASGSTSQTSAATGGAGGRAPEEPPRVLLFSKTSGFRHASIPDAIAALEAEGAARSWTLAATEEASWFDGATLAGFDVVVFLLTTGDVLDDAQQAAFEAFVRAGGGYAGVHSASDTEFGWPWYGELVGAYFAGHPAVQPAIVTVEDAAHPATAHLASADWMRTDEWYSFDHNPRREVDVLLSLDETSYDPGGLAMGDHPIAWSQPYDGGRAFYTAGGHTSESYAEPDFLAHVVGGIAWAAAR